MTRRGCILASLGVVLLSGLGCRQQPPQEIRSQAAGAPAARAAEPLILDLGGGVTMKCILIPAGTFGMGISPTDPDPFSWEGPRHKVTLTKPFYVGVFEVTQQQYEQVVGKNPSRAQGKENHVDNVLYAEAAEFCKLLSRKSGRTVRLPTEAEWEYACRAGTQTLFCYGDDPGFRELDNYAWYRKNSGSRAHRVGRKMPNRWGLCDMHGNVWEWCSDWYDGRYRAADQTDPTGVATGAMRVIRGGGWDSTPLYARSTTRLRYDPYRRGYNIGFRVVVETKP